MERIAHICYIPFVGVGINDSKGDTWLDYRIQIFKDYTLKSLLNQSAKYFLLWLSFRPEDQGNKKIIELQKYIEKQGIKCIFTYQGLIYWDDKFSSDWPTRLKNVARVLRQRWREKSLTGIMRIKVIFTDQKNKTLPERLKRSLDTLMASADFNVDWVYLTRLDSDDMFRKDAFKEIQSIKPATKKAIVCTKGLVYNSFTNELAEWVPPTNPPFHTIIFPADVFFNPEAHMGYMMGFRSHEDIPKIFTTQKLKDWSYCVTIHGNHISTLWDHPFRGDVVYHTLYDKSFVLNQFGL